MNGKQFWIQIWPEKIKQSKRNNNSKALSFLETWVLNDPSNALNELIEGTNAYKAGKWGSAYVVQIPNGDKEAIRNRWSNHPSKETEWPLKEIDGLPNRRYSLYIYDKNTVPEFANIAETKWKSYYSEGIPVYEKGFNVDFLRKTFPKLKNILLMIYKGGVPQPSKLPINIKESITNNKQDTNMKTENRKRNVVRLTESKLKQIVAESVKKVLKESVYTEYFVKCVECYTEGGEDIVFVAALSETGGDGIAMRRVMEKFPNLEIISVSDVSGSIKVGDMSRIQRQFCNNGGAMIVDDVINNVDDLEWYGDE